MTDVPSTAKIRSEKVTAIESEKPKPVVPIFELPTFEMPNYAKHGLTQAKESCAKAKIAVEAASAAMGDSFAVVGRGGSDWGLKVIEAACANYSAMLDYAGELLGAKTVSDVIDLTTKRAHKQFEAFVTQTTEFTALVQRVAIDAGEPMKAGITKALRNAA